MTNKVKKNRKIFYTWLVTNYDKETKQAFIRNVRNQNGFKNFYDTLNSCPNNVIDKSFDWFCTPERGIFWNNIDEKLSHDKLSWHR